MISRRIVSKEEFQELRNAIARIIICTLLVIRKVLDSPWNAQVFNAFANHRSDGTS